MRTMTFRMDMKQTIIVAVGGASICALVVGVITYQFLSIDHNEQAGDSNRHQRLGAISQPPRSPLVEEVVVSKQSRIDAAESPIEPTDVGFGAATEDRDSADRFIQTAPSSGSYQRVATILAQVAAIDENTNRDNWIRIRTQILQLISQNAEIVDGLLVEYPLLASDREKTLLRDVLQFVDRGKLESYAVKRIRDSHPSQITDWLRLSQSVGVTTSKNQQEVLDQLPFLDSVGDLRVAIRVLVPDSQVGMDRQQLLDQLAPYTNHADERIRVAVTQKIGEWVGSDESYYVEEALADASVSVQESAILSLSASGIQSDPIKLSLMSTVNNDSVDWNLRITAHNALASYDLYGTELDNFVRFRQLRQIPPKDSNEG